MKTYILKLPAEMFPADLAHLLKNSLMENFIFCALISVSESCFKTKYSAKVSYFRARSPQNGGSFKS